MTEAATLLKLLQQGDSFFPSGSLIFSGGLETLAEEGLLTTVDEVAQFLRAQIFGRWADFDRPLVAGAHDAAPDLEAVMELDRLVEAQMLVRELREGSHKVSRALLGVHSRLETAGAAAYRDLVGAGVPGVGLEIPGPNRADREPLTSRFRLCGRQGLAHSRRVNLGPIWPSRSHRVDQTGRQ